MSLVVCVVTMVLCVCVYLFAAGTDIHARQAQTKQLFISWHATRLFSVFHSISRATAQTPFKNVISYNQKPLHKGEYNIRKCTFKNKQTHDDNLVDSRSGCHLGLLDIHRNHRRQLCGKICLTFFPPAIFPVLPEFWSSLEPSCLFSPPFHRRALSLLPSHLSTSHLLLPSLLLFCVSCPPLRDLLGAHSRAHRTTAWSRESFILIIFIKRWMRCSPFIALLLCPLMPAGIFSWSVLIWLVEEDAYSEQKPFEWTS